ncbi:MAG: N-acetylmuramoyl-L-alanine amidase [Campylobacterales bacterium]|nr:N-acetylmuramoyl-L-alanine amidase [Campylobacterales bacterium]
MLRLLVITLALFLTLYAQSDTELLQRADKFLKSSSKTDQFRAYNDYKNLYLRALMDGNDKLRQSALYGIVQSGEKLRIDVSQYADELEKIKPKTSYKAPKSKDIPQTKSSQNISVTASHKLKSIRWKESRLVLKFDKELLSKQLNYFTLYDTKNKRYRYIFDIHASMLTHSQNLRKKGIDRIKIAQFNPDTLRLVIENSKELDVSFLQESDQLRIKIGDDEESLSEVSTIAQKYTAPSKKGKVIVIDAGHGGKDPGAIGYKKYREKIVVLQIAQELKTILKSRGYKVYMTRNKDKFLKLRERTQYANKKGADLFISIHANAVGGKTAKKAYGVECYFLDKSRSSRAKKVAAQENSADMSEMDFYGKESFLHTLSSHNIIAANKLAIDLQRGMLNSLRKSYKDIKDGGVRPAPFWVLVGAQMPAVLVEVGFITHPMEAKRLVDKTYQKKLALGLANGVERYFLNN